MLTGVINKNSDGDPTGVTNFTYTLSNHVSSISYEALARYTSIMNDARLKVFQLAKELGIDSKTIVKKCKDERIPNIETHMSFLTKGVAATIREWFNTGEMRSALDSEKGDPPPDSDNPGPAGRLAPRKPTPALRSGGAQAHPPA